VRNDTLNARLIGTGVGLLAAFAVLKLLVHAAVGNGYGYFRDEFYYLACADHLAWGYVDQPPFSILVLWISRGLIGDSVWAIRLPAALAGAATVVLAGWMARRLGGGAFGQVLAMTSVLVAPIYLAMTGYYSMNAFDFLFWALAAAILLEIVGIEPSAARRGAPEAARAAKLWVVLGVVLGLGLMNKISVLWLGFGIFVGLLATRERDWLRTPWPWISGTIAALIFAPHILWQAANSWPTLEFIRNASAFKMLENSALTFVADQLVLMSPLAAPIWIAGLVSLLRGRHNPRLRIFGVIYITAAAILVINDTSRSVYLGPAYTVLFAAGGVATERLLTRIGMVRIGGAAIVAIVAVFGVVMAPFVLPILPVDTYIEYAQSIGIEPDTDERKELAHLPQHYADMFGWEEIVVAVADAFETLSADEKEVAGVFAQDYGVAGAIDLLGRSRGLPMAISGHNNYWLWGPRGYTGEVMIIVGGSEEDHRTAFASLTMVGRTDCGYCMPYENNQPIFVGRGLLAPIGLIWPGVKHFD